MKTIAKLYKEYGGFFGIFAIFSWLALIISSTWLILHINSAKADTKINPDCIYYDEEKSGYKGISIGSVVTYDVQTNHKGKNQAVNIKIIS